MGAGKPACSGPAASPIRRRALPSHPGEESRAVIFPVKQPKFQERGPGCQTPAPPSHHRAPMCSVPFCFPSLDVLQCLPARGWLQGGGGKQPGRAARPPGFPRASPCSDPHPRSGKGILALCLHPESAGSRGAAARCSDRGSNGERGWEDGEGVDADASCAKKKRKKSNPKQNNNKPRLPSGS